MEPNNKCIFAVSELQPLGHKIRSCSLTPVESKVQAIVNAPRPTDAKSLQSFLRRVSYHAKFVSQYADVVEPLCILLREGQPFTGSVEPEQSFIRI